MPYSFYFDADNRIVLARFTGRVTDEELIEFFRHGGRRVVATIDFRSVLIDFSDVSAFDVTADTVRMLAWEEPIDPDPSRLRVMVAPEPHVYGLCRIFSAHGEDTRPNLHVVRSMEHARAILGVTNPKFDPLDTFDAASS